MDFHLYDGIERRYRHTDLVQNVGLQAVAQLLDLPEPPARDVLLYDLSFHSGGWGVLDRLAITLSADPIIWESVIKTVKAMTPEEASTKESWVADLVWLFTGEELPVPLRPAAARFINFERYQFQSECHSSSRILFQLDSDVNEWVALWGDDAKLNYRAYSHG